MPRGIRRLIDIVDNEESPIEGASRPSSLPARELLPLPANDEQYRIVRSVSNRLHTVVQGPPGTGKTHTIANLVSNLLAQGQRVLVTAYTDRALYELQDKLPPSVANLTVSAVGRSRADLGELRTAVQTLDAMATSFDYQESAARISALESTLDEIRREQSALSSRMLEQRERETRRYQHGRYEGTLSSIAEQHATEASQFAWLAEFLDGHLPDSPPISNEQATQWLALLCDEQVIRERENLDPGLVDPATLPEPETFRAMASRAREAVEIADSSVAEQNHPAYQPAWALSESQRQALRGRLEETSRLIAKLTGRPEVWMADALLAIFTGRELEWTQRYSELRKGLDEVKPVVDRIGAAPELKWGSRLDEDAVVEFAEILKKHLERGKRLHGLIRPPAIVRLTAPFLDDVRVDGKPADTIERLERVLDIIEANRQLRHVERLWPSSVKVAFEDTPWERWAWNQSETAQLEKVIDLGQRLAAVARALEDVAIVAPDWRNPNAIGSLQAALVAASHAEEATAASAPLVELEARVCLEAGPDSSVANRNAYEAITERDYHKYRYAWDRLSVLEAVRGKLGMSDSLSSPLRSIAPELVDAVSSGDAEVWARRLSSIEEAWGWMGCGTWLVTQGETDIASLRRESAILEQRRRAVVTELVSAQAEVHAVERLGQAEMQALRQYALMVQKLGRGTGRYAPLRRKQARDALQACRSAIPAWIMPIYRVAQTLEIGPDLFDVVIIDEASQAGVEALFLQYLAPRMVVVGDDKQVSPAAVGIVHQQLIGLGNQLLHDVPQSATFTNPTISFFDQARLRYGSVITLREHFRCVPEIIGFSNRIAYEPDNVPLIPLRQFGSDRLPPIKTVYIPDGYREGGGSNSVNVPEVEEVVETILKCCADPAYDGKTMGVISLTGSAQAAEIERRLLDALDPTEFRQRDLRCGDAAAFQGSERDVMFLSMVAAYGSDTRVTALTGDIYVQRFNVAASRAKDQMWVFHSISRDELTNPEGMRYQLLDYCESILRRTGGGQQALPSLVAEDIRVDPFDSLFEQRVFNRIVERGYMVEPQYEVYAYRIDLAVVGGNAKLAVECDGDTWHGADQYESDMRRQRELERCGWRFFRLPGSTFYRNPNAALEPLWELLDEVGIQPNGRSPAAQASETITAEPQVDLPIVDLDGSGTGSSHGEEPDAAGLEGQAASAGLATTDLWHGQSGSDELEADQQLQPQAQDNEQELIRQEERPNDDQVDAPLSIGSTVDHARLGEARVVHHAVEADPAVAEEFFVRLRFRDGREYDYSADEFDRAGFTVPTRPATPHMSDVTTESKPEFGHDVDAPTVAPPVAEPQRTATTSFRTSRVPPVTPESDQGNAESSPGLGAYIEWSGDRLPDPRIAPKPQVAASLSRIIEVEGPVTAERAFRVFASSAGISRLKRLVRESLEQALHHLGPEVDVDQFVDGVSAEPQRALRLRGSPPVRRREIGPRDLYDVPLNEVASLIDLIMADRFPPRSAEELMRAVLDTYSTGESSDRREKLTKKRQDYLKAAMALREESPAGTE
ncbi:AAA domain-containing protein [Actinomycetota bacterium]